MNPEDFPAPREGFVLTHFLIVSDQDRSRDFYQMLFDGTVVLERDPVILRVANSWLILNEGGGPTDDKPTVTLTTPPDPDRSSGFLNVRVADIQKVYADWSAKGVEFLTEPKDHGREIRRLRPRSGWSPHRGRAVHSCLGLNATMADAVDGRRASWTSIQLRAHRCRAARAPRARRLPHGVLTTGSGKSARSAGRARGQGRPLV